MRWTKPKIGAERTIKKFCWLPCRAGTEIVWLEKVTIRQQYVGWWHNLYFE